MSRKEAVKTGQYYVGKSGAGKNYVRLIAHVENGTAFYIDFGPSDMEEGSHPLRSSCLCSSVKSWGNLISLEEAKNIFPNILTRETRSWGVEKTAFFTAGMLPDTIIKAEAELRGLISSV